MIRLIFLRFAAAIIVKFMGGEAEIASLRFSKDRSQHWGGCDGCFSRGLVLWLPTHCRRR